MRSKAVPVGVEKTKSAVGGPARRVVVRTLSAAAVAALLLLSLLAGTAWAFPDVPPGHSYYAAVQGIAARQIISGFEDGMFRPADPVKRAQFAKMVDGTMGLQVGEASLPLPPFTDLGENDAATLYPHDYVAAAYWAGITTGKTAATFAPWDPITRAQMVTMVVRAANSLEPGALDPVPDDFEPTIGYFSDVHSPTMDRADANGLLAGLVGFSASWDPYAEATRGECAQVLWNLIRKMEGSLEGRPIPSFVELQPSDPVDFTIALDLSNVAATVQATGGTQRALEVNDMTLTGHLTLQILSVTSTEAILRLRLDEVALPEDFADTDISDLLPCVMTLAVNEQGSIQSIDYSMGEKPVEHMNAQEMAQVIPLLAPLVEVLFVPNFADYRRLGQTLDTSRSYSVPAGPKLVDVAVHSRFESLSNGIAVLSYSLAVTNINTTIIVDIMPLLERLLGAGSEPGHAAILVLRLTGSITSEGRLDIDTKAGLPMSVTGASDLDLLAQIQQAPPDLAEFVPVFEGAETVSLDGLLGLDLARE